MFTLNEMCFFLPTARSLVSELKITKVWLPFNYFRVVYCSTLWSGWITYLARLFSEEILVNECFIRSDCDTIDWKTWVLSKCMFVLLPNLSHQAKKRHLFSKWPKNTFNCQCIQLNCFCCAWLIPEEPFLFNQSMSRLNQNAELKCQCALDQSKRKVVFLNLLSQQRAFQKFEKSLKSGSP